MTTPKSASELVFRKEPPTDAEWVELIDVLRLLIKSRMREMRLLKLGDVRVWKKTWTGMTPLAGEKPPPTLLEAYGVFVDPSVDMRIWRLMEMQGLFHLDKIGARYEISGFCESENPPFRVLSGNVPTKEKREYVFWGLNRDAHWVVVRLIAELDQREDSLWRAKFFYPTEITADIVDSPIAVVQAMQTMESAWVDGLPGIWVALTQMIEGMHSYALNRYKSMQEVYEQMDAERHLIRGANGTHWRIRALF